MSTRGRWFIYASCSVALAALIAGGVMWRKGRARVNEVRMQANALATSIWSYRNEYGEQAERFFAAGDFDTDQPRGGRLVRAIFGREPEGEGMLNPRQIPFMTRIDEHESRWLESKKAGTFLDPWGKAFHVRITADAVSVVSDGPDLKAGTWDDVVATSGR